MNVLLINHYGGSPSLGMEFRPWYLAREWQRAGHAVTIVASTASHVRHHPVTVSQDLTERQHDGQRYMWVRTPAYAGNGVRRALNVMGFAGQLVRHAASLRARYAPDVVIASSTHPLDIVGAERIARLAGARLIFEVHDLWPLSPIELGGMSPGHPFIRLLQWGENRAYRRADRVVSMLPAARPHMERHGMAPEKWAYVPNGVDPDEWADADPAPAATATAVIAEARDRGEFLVCYAGAHGVANDLRVLVEAAARLTHVPVRVVCIGQGPEKASLEALAAARGAPVTFLEAIPKRQIPATLRAMDVLYIGLQPQSLFRFGISPNKLLDYMMAGRPILQAITAGNDPVRDAGCGLSVPAGDPAAVASAIETLRATPASEREAMGARGTAYVLREHDYRQLAIRFLEVMR
jgi:glycosyltransferase involved in cell wall biosynthesis